MTRFSKSLWAIPIDYIFLKSLRFMLCWTLRTTTMSSWHVLCWQPLPFLNTCTEHLRRFLYAFCLTIFPLCCQPVDLCQLVHTFRLIISVNFHKFLSISVSIAIMSVLVSEVDTDLFFNASTHVHFISCFDNFSTQCCFLDKVLMQPFYPNILPFNIRRTYEMF